jgi:HD-GYP domain-containing protein (c-di-GMP phosphodiesterase class II)
MTPASTTNPQPRPSGGGATAPGFDAPRDMRTVIKIAITLLVIIGATAAAVVFILRFVADARERDTQAWQVRLGIVADSRADAVETWLEGQFATLRGLADNDSLKIYLVRMTQAAKTGDPLVTPEAQYLRNLLMVTASRTGFGARPQGRRLPAGARHAGDAGIALIDMNGRMIISTPDFPPGEAGLAKFLKALPRGQRGLYGPYRAASGELTVAFAEPVYSIQSDPRPENQVAVALGIKPFEGEVMPLLKQPGAVSASQEIMLVRTKGETVEYLSPLANGTKAMTLALARETPNLAAAFALARPGGFGLKRDYRGRHVLATGRALKAAPWAVVVKVDRAEALGPSDARARRLLIILLLGVGLALAAGFALWRHGASMRASQSAARFREMAERFEQQSRFLTLLTDSQPNAIFISDTNAICRFANAEAGRRSGTDYGAMVGKPLADVVGANRARKIQALNAQALAEDETVTDIHRSGSGAKERVYQTQHIPLPPNTLVTDGVLIVEEDITAAVIEREHRARSLRELVGALVTLVDQRDAHAADHSARVGALARTVAAEMGLDETQCETAEYTGTLMNLGKILVPEEILAKKGKLTPGEMRQVRAGVHATADLLAGVPFDGPVIEALHQIQAHWDGSGEPKGLMGDHILPAARIAAAANAFVALVSPRAHREGHSIDAAIETLLADAGKRYDRKVIAALINHLDNRGGRAAFATVDAESSREPQTAR